MNIYRTDNALSVKINPFRKIDNKILINRYQLNKL